MLQLLFILVKIKLLDISYFQKFAASIAPTLKLNCKGNSYKRCGGEEIILIGSLSVSLWQKLQVRSIEQLRRERIVLILHKSTVFILILHKSTVFHLQRRKLHVKV